MYYKKALFFFIVFIFLLSLFIPVTIYIHDPYTLFHKQRFHKDKIYDNLRVADYGIIKYEDFDNFILGSSMLENTSALEVAEKFGGKWVNLSFSGARWYERLKIINLALSHKKIKNIIISADHNWYTYFENTFEPKLYDHDFKTKWKIYLTTKSFRCALFDICHLKDKNLDKPNSWADDKSNYQRFGGFDNWIKFHNNSQIQDAFHQLLSTEKSCDPNLKNYINGIDTTLSSWGNKNTQFHLIIPPYSALYWADDFSDFDCKMSPYKYLIEKASLYPNIKIYWLYDEDFVFDIANYKDLTHYHQKINSLQIDYIKNNSHLIDIHNYHQKINDFKKKIEVFDLQYYIDKINKLYNK